MATGAATKATTQRLTSSAINNIIPKFVPRGTTTIMSPQQKITRWSLNSLAHLKRDLVATSTAKNGSAALKVVTPQALALARDITLRLGAQKAQVEQMEAYVQQRLQPSSTSNSGDQINSKSDPNRSHHQNFNSTTTSNKQGKIIQTSNFSQPQWWKREQNSSDVTSKLSAKEKAQRQYALEKAKQNLHNLKVLHDNTEDIAGTLWRHLTTKTADDQFLDKKETKWIKAALRQVRDRHALTVENLAEFVITTRPYWETPTSLDNVVMNFLRGRFGIQLLCEHYLAPYPPNFEQNEGGTGIVCVDCHLKNVLEDAISEARLLCESNYSHLVTAAPEVVIVNHTIDRNDQFTIVRPWVHYVLVELLKNAMAVSMERMCRQQVPHHYEDGSGGEDEYYDINCLPPTIYIAIDDHHEEGDDLKSYLSIDIYDQGGGFQQQQQSSKKKDADFDPTSVLFDFVRTKTTMWDRLDDQQTYAMTRSPMQGLGVGLCLSRLAMQHFGGTVELRQHPPLTSLEQQILGFAGNQQKLEAGCVASIRLLKDLNHPEELYVEDLVEDKEETRHYQNNSAESSDSQESDLEQILSQ